MIKRSFIINFILLLCILPVTAQEKQLKREVTLYNPYKPSLNEFRKKSLMPELNDTARYKPDFTYNVNTFPFQPAYTVSPIRAASLSPEPLSKLYRSYVNIGFGNYTSPLAEISITNERSKKGSVGFYGRHFSNNGYMKLNNGRKVFAGYMDNDASLFGRRFIGGSVLGVSGDIMQRTRYAYGYDPKILDYLPGKKDIRMNYANLGAKISLTSMNLDSARFSYDFVVHFDHFYGGGNFAQNNFGFSGLMSKSFRGFYVGSGLEYDYYRIPDILLKNPKFIASVSPFVKKSTELWNFKLGIQALLEKNMTDKARLHIYPDINFGFAIVPSYINFFAGLSGMLGINDPLHAIASNPFLIPDGSLYTLPNTDHQLSVKAGLKGNTGIGGNYLISASYSLINDMLFFTNIEYKDSLFTPERGNFFAPLTDDVDLLNLHGEMSSVLSEKLTFNGEVNFNKYTTTNFEHAWNKPAWDATAGLKYNLRNKIIAGVQVTALGDRYLVINGNNLNDETAVNKAVVLNEPFHLNLNLSAEYRYTKILSFWARMNNISYGKYYEWAYYPSHRFLFMLGFTYSL